MGYLHGTLKKFCKNLMYKKSKCNDNQLSNFCLVEEILHQSHKK